MLPLTGVDPDLMQAKPRVQIDDGHFIVHHHPRYGTTYTVVFGRQGVVYGANIFIGDVGLDNLLTMILDDRLALVRNAVCLTITSNG